MVRESRLIWNPISSQVRQTIPYSLQVYDLEFQDNIWVDLGHATHIDEQAFHLVELPIRPAEKPDDNVHFRISYERDLNLRVVERTTYGILDMLGDVGGVSGMFFSIGLFLVNILQFQAFENYMVS